ncbi:MAG: HAD family hydrolase [Promethearchaeota archaeon]|nr:MAG: HAD family hydrolase [Candidatus Lokiarchaeota archaeon]
MNGKLDGKIKAILFDLDCTLLDIDLDKFIPEYLKSLAQSVAHLIPPKKFISKILQASNAIEQNDGTISNLEVYEKVFFPIEGYSWEQLEPYFNEYYEKDFPKLCQYADKKPEARAVVQKAFDKGYDVIIATTPLLPATAIEQRLEWADVADFPYRLITTIENSHATKSTTHLLYYDQILNKIGYPADACLMVGDEDKDLVAKRCGMKTFLIEHKDKKFSLEIPEPTYKGSLYDLKLML